MKAKLFNTTCALLLLMQGFCYADTKSITIEPDAEVHIVRSPIGNFMVIDSKTGRVHLKSKDIDGLMDDPNLAEVIKPNVNTRTSPQQSQDQNIDDNDADQKIKLYSKSYSVDADTKLNINNRYGKVSVNTWNKNEIKVDVQIKVSANKPEDTNNLLNSITIDDSRSGQTISFKTNIANGSQSFLSSLGNKNRKMEINYTIYMPAINALSINNKYGDIDLPDLDGKLDINCAYGDLTAKALNNPANEIKVSYGDARIVGLRATDLDIKYGSLVLGWVDKLNADMSYSSAKIGKISTSGNINIKYGGGLKIADIDKNLKSLLVDSKYASITVGLNNAENADFDVTVKYGSFNYDNRPVKMQKSVPVEDTRWNPTKNFKGHLGKGDVEKMININSAYSSVRFD